MLGMATSHSDGLVAEHFPTARELAAAGARLDSVPASSAFAHAPVHIPAHITGLMIAVMSKSGVGMVCGACQQRGSIYFL